jgi:hypothetical protein
VKKSGGGGERSVGSESAEGAVVAQGVEGEVSVK